MKKPIFFTATISLFALLLSSCSSPEVETSKTTEQRLSEGTEAVSSFYEETSSEIESELIIEETAPATQAASEKLTLPDSTTAVTNSNIGTSSITKKAVSTSAPTTSNKTNTSTTEKTISTTQQPTTTRPIYTTNLPYYTYPSTTKNTTTSAKPSTTKPTTTKPTTTKPTTTKPAPQISLEDYAKEVVRLVNVERANEGVNPLSIDSTICKAANVRAKELYNSFSHTRPDGTTCFTVFDDFSIEYWAVGENIAYGHIYPEDVMDSWMNSPGHCANILSSSYNSIGVGVYEKNGILYWVQLFAYL